MGIWLDSSEVKDKELKCQRIKSWLEEKVWRMFKKFQKGKMPDHQGKKDEPSSAVRNDR